MTDEPRPLKDMPAEYVGDIYKALWAGEPLQVWAPVTNEWLEKFEYSTFSPRRAYRRKPEPRIKTDVLYGAENGGWSIMQHFHPTHRLTITWTNGEATAEVEKL